MRFFTVTERELRTAARSAALFRVRWLSALLAFAFLVWLGWVEDVHLNRSAGPKVFHGFAYAIFAYCLLIGAAGTADGISRERREGTLGLLFLTNLNSGEIVTGKLGAHALLWLYSLVAMLPMLASLFLLGGLMPAEFLRTVLALLAALGFGVACGFTASCLCIRQFPATALATGLAIFGGMAWLGLVALLNRNGLSNVAAERLASFCPLHTLLCAERGFGLIPKPVYWWSLAKVSGVSLGMLSLVAWRLRGVWRDRPRTSWRWPRLWRKQTANPTKPGSKPLQRRRWLEINPLFWLGARQSLSAPVFMVLTLGLAVIATELAGPFFGNTMGGGVVGPLVGMMFAWIWTALIVHALTIYHAGMVASQRVAEDKQAGALELILSTPLSDRDISRGLWLAFARRMFFPAIAATGAHCVLIWQVLNLCLFDPPGSNGPMKGTAWHLFWASLFNTTLDGQGVPWEMVIMIRALVLALGAFAVNWLMLGWLGRWLGIRLKHPGFAPLIAMAAAIVPPGLGFSLFCFVMSQVQGFNLPGRQVVPLMIGSFLGLIGLNCLVWSVWSAGRLRREFRTVVTSRFEPTTPTNWWRALWSIGWRLTAGAATLLVLVALAGVVYRAVQNRTGRRHWAEFQLKLKQSGESLDLAPYLPRQLPTAGNLAFAPAFREYLDLSPNNRLAFKNTSGPNLYQIAIGYGGSPLQLTPWQQQTNLDAESVAVSLGLLPSTNSLLTSVAAADRLLESWRPAKPLLDRLVEASRLPAFQVSTNLTPETVYATKTREILALEQLHLLLSLRACAALELGQSHAAAADVAATLRLAALAQQTPDLHSSLRTQVLLERSLQPLWEGLASHQWGGPELQEFQHDLESFQLFAGYTNAVQRLVRTCIATWSAIPDTRQWQGRIPQGDNTFVERSRWQPRAWWFECCIQLHKAGQVALHRLDLEHNRFSGEADWSALDGLPLSSESQQLLQQARWWGREDARVAQVQINLNQALTACAIERFRLARGALPDELRQLVPEFLSELPTDCETGHLLHYFKSSPSDYELRAAGGDGRVQPGQANTDDILWTLAPITNSVPPRRAPKVTVTR